MKKCIDESAPPIISETNNNKNIFLLQNNSCNKTNLFHNFCTINNKIEPKNNIKGTNLKIEEDKIEQKNVRIAIKTEKLNLLEHQKLVELIQFIEYTCDLTLNDERYINTTYNIFKIIRNVEKNAYDIIIDDEKEVKMNEKLKEQKNEINDEKDEDYSYEEEESVNTMKYKINNENSSSYDEDENDSFDSMGKKYNCIQFNKKIINNNENYKIENNRNNIDLNKRKDESDEIKKDTKNSINLNTPSSPFEFNDYKNKNKNKDEKKEEKIKNNYINF